MDLFDSRPTILRFPAWYSESLPEERPLPLRPGDYKVTPGIGHDARWTVTDLKGEMVYNGIGPVTIE